MAVIFCTITCLINSVRWLFNGTFYRKMNLSKLKILKAKENQKSKGCKACRYMFKLLGVPGLQFNRTIFMINENQILTTISFPDFNYKTLYFVYY